MNSTFLKRSVLEKLLCIYLNQESKNYNKTIVLFTNNLKRLLQISASDNNFLCIKILSRRHVLASLVICHNNYSVFCLFV